MNHYMAEFVLPGFLSQAFIELIPQQREYINELFEKGMITGYSLSADRHKLWVTFAAGSKSEVESLVRNFPIYQYVQYEITELLFHDSAMVLIPSISLN